MARENIPLAVNLVCFCPRHWISKLSFGDSAGRAGALAARRCILDLPTSAFQARVCVNLTEAFKDLISASLDTKTSSKAFLSMWVYSASVSGFVFCRFCSYQHPAQTDRKAPSVPPCPGTYGEVNPIRRNRSGERGLMGKCSPVPGDLWGLMVFPRTRTGAAREVVLRVVLFNNRTQNPWAQPSLKLIGRLEACIHGNLSGKG